MIMDTRRELPFIFIDGTRVRKSPCWEATERAGCQSYDIYNHMLITGTLRCLETSCRRVSDRRSHQQAADRLDDGRGRLALGEDAEDARHRVRRNEAATDEHREHQWHRQVARRLHALGAKAEGSGQPHDREREEPKQPATATHSTALAFGRKPTASATPTTATRLTIVWIVLPRTWPVSTAPGAMPIVPMMLAS
jgi:hypothetical protein